MKYNIFSGKLKVLILGLVASTVLSGVVTPQTINADYEKVSEPVVKVVKTIKMVVTAYSSTPDQTDDTPEITASGKRVYDGIIANNGLPFGTRVRIPSLYGDKIFVVEDRMHKRKGNYHADIWFPTFKEAKNFGAKYNVEIQVLES